MSAPSRGSRSVRPWGSQTPETVLLQPLPTPSRRILLTGASSGIGFEAAVVLGRSGQRLTLPCRDKATAEATLRRLAERAGAGLEADAPVCDLADLESVDRCAEALLERGEPVDSLVLNAGLQYAGGREPRRSGQGVELTFAVNHLAHHRLAMRLLPLLDSVLSPGAGSPAGPLPA